MAGKFEIGKAGNGQFIFRLKAGNGEIIYFLLTAGNHEVIGNSQAHTDSVGMENGIER